MKKIFITCLFLMSPFLLFAQNGTITGKILDEEGYPLLGANVLVETTTLGAATDSEGVYNISIPAGTYTITARFIGFKTQSIENVIVEDGKTTEVNFNLDVAVLASGEEIVVVGYGVQQKREVTGAISSVEVREIQKMPTANVGTALQGAAPGVNVTNASGAPGTSPKISIRGTGTLGRNDPLYIIDGVPSNDIDYLNPTDIESMDILKDASMSAIYGSRAANGVLIIKTKRGKPRSGDPGDIRISYSNFFGNQSLDKSFPLITNRDDYIKVAKRGLINVGIDYKTDFDGSHFLNRYDADPSQFSSSDWEDEYFQSAFEHKHDLSVSAGNENFNVAVMGMYSDMKGLVINTDVEKMSIRVNSDFRKGILTIGQSASAGRQTGNGRYKRHESFYHISRLAPISPIYDNTPSGYGSQMDINGLDNQAVNTILQNNLNENSWDEVKVMLSGYVELDILDNLKYTFRLSKNLTDGYWFNYTPSYYTNEIDNIPTTSMDETRDRTDHSILETFVNFNEKFGEHSVEAMIGYAQESKDWRSTEGYVQEFPNNDLRVLGAGEAGDDASGWAEEWRLQSYFGRVTYSYADRYLVTANLRRDGSSRFDSDNRWGSFPSFSAGWRVSKESFFNVPWITDLKVRGGYGELGLQEFDDYQYIPKIEKDQNGRLNYPFGEGRDQIIYIGARSLNFPSVGIQWESSKETNIGFDMGMFNDKLTFSADYYLRTSEGILFQVPIPISAGSVDPPTINSASIDNSGLEFAIVYKNFDKEFKYQVSANVSTYTNEVTKMGKYGDEAIWGGEIHWGLDYTTKTVVGQPIASFFLYETAGLFRSQADVDAYTKNGQKIQPDAKPGDVKYVDTNNDGEITGDDKKFMGSAIPDVEFGINFTGKYSDFDFTLNLYTSIGKDMINGARWMTMNTDKFHGMHEDQLDSWTESNKDTDIPRFVYGDERNVQASDMWLEDASYLRIRLLEIGYTLPRELTNTWGLGSLRVFAAAENLLTITGYSGYDPSVETWESGSIFDRGADRSPYPLARKFLMGIQVNL